MIQIVGELFNIDLTIIKLFIKFIIMSIREKYWK